MINSRVLSSLNPKQIGIHLSRPRSPRGELSESMPKRGKLARGRSWARWRIYLRQPDGIETVKRAEKIIDRAVAEQLGFVLDYTGMLTKTDARKVLEALIRESNNRPAAFTAKTTFGDIAREYINLNKPNLGNQHNPCERPDYRGSPYRQAGSQARPCVVGFGIAAIYEQLCRAGSKPVASGEARAFPSRDSQYGHRSRDHPAQSARKLRAKSRKRACNLAHSLEECDLLLAQVSGADHVTIRLLIQLGLRSEELFALRRNDVQANGLVIHEAIVDGEAKDTKTLASAAMMYLTPDLELELKHYLGTIPEAPDGWLFPSSRKGVPTRPGNFLNRVLKPAAVRAGLVLRDLGGGKVTSAVNFQSLRRTSSTLFGARVRTRPARAETQKGRSTEASSENLPIF